MNEGHSKEEVIGWPAASSIRSLMSVRKVWPLWIEFPGIPSPPLTFVCPRPFIAEQAVLSTDDGGAFSRWACQISYLTLKIAWQFFFSYAGMVWKGWL